MNARPRTNGTRRPPLPHAHVHLPPLSADYALTLVAILDRTIRAVWRAHGYDMSQLRTMREDTAACPRPRAHAAAHEDPELPF